MSFRILLVNPWIVDFTAYNLWSKPLGLLYIASVLIENGIENLQLIDCLDNTHPSTNSFKIKVKPDGTSTYYWEEINKPEIFRDVPRVYRRFGIPLSAFDFELEKVGKVDAVLVTSVMTYWYQGVQLVIERVRKKLGSVPIILGGIYPTLCPDHARKESGADLVVEGEGENKIAGALSSVLSSRFNFKQYTDLDSIPFPEYGLMGEKNVCAFLTSRGCPYRCYYCASTIISGKFRRRSIENCIRELMVLSKNFHTKHIAFYDDALLTEKDEHFKPLLREILNHRLAFEFHTPNGICLSEIDDEVAILMKKANFKTVRVSLESSKEEFFLRTKSSHKAGDLKKVVNLFEKAGYQRDQIEVYIFAGLPFQDAGEVEQSMRLAEECGVKVRFSFFSPVPGTKEFYKMKAEGLLKNSDDPLITNKVVFPYFWSKITPDGLKYLKRLQGEINRKVSQKKVGY